MNQPLQSLALLCNIALLVAVSTMASAQSPMPLADPPPVHSDAGAILYETPLHLTQMGPPHFVIASPQIQAAQDPSARSLHGPKRSYPVELSGATRVPVWKQPYSYGHFGASHTRHWSLHHGHQRSYTQWTLR